MGTKVLPLVKGLALNVELAAIVIKQEVLVPTHKSSLLAQGITTNAPLKF